ncbi:uncharacterized protein FFE2_16082 [Fusarium fujikuroi]|nr:uncharacterized protein FFE2_16082 [Fusarium fujikuroi]
MAAIIALSFGLTD